MRSTHATSHLDDSRLYCRRRDRRVRARTGARAATTTAPGSRRDAGTEINSHGLRGAGENDGRRHHVCPEQGRRWVGKVVRAWRIVPTGVVSERQQEGRSDRTGARTAERKQGRCARSESTASAADRRRVGQGGGRKLPVSCRTLPHFYV